RHHHHRQMPVAVGRPAGVARQLEQVDGVEDVVGELDLRHRALARHGEAHRRGDDPALVEGRVPGGLQALGAGEDAAQRRAYFLSQKMLFQIDSGAGSGSSRACLAFAEISAFQRSRTSSIAWRVITPAASSFCSNWAMQSTSPVTKLAPEAEEWP